MMRTFPDEQLAPQSIDSWCGEFPLPIEVAHYYQEFGPVNVTIDGYGNPYFLPSLAKLWEYQAGYRYHGVTKEPLDGWEEDWLVIADVGADPFIYSRSTGKILFAEHGQGVWEPDELFSSLAEMVTVLALLGEVAIEAGSDFTDEDGYLQSRPVAKAKQQIAQYLRSEAEAIALLFRLGWIDRR